MVGLLLLDHSLRAGTAETRRGTTQILEWADSNSVSTDHAFCSDTSHWKYCRHWTPSTIICPSDYLHSHGTVASCKIYHLNKLQLGGSFHKPFQPKSRGGTIMNQSVLSFSLFIFGSAIKRHHICLCETLCHFHILTLMPLENMGSL